MRTKKANISVASVQFEKHQPERRRGFGGYLFCGGGCCCCSCCLHTLGGLIGAAAASATTKSPEGGSVAGFYWTCVVIMAAVTGFALGALSVVMGLMAVLVFLPVVQLVASLVTLIWLLTRGPEFPEREGSLQTLGSITIWSFVGALLGALATWIGFQMFNS